MSGDNCGNPPGLPGSRHGGRGDAANPIGASTSSRPSSSFDRQVVIPVEGLELHGLLSVPPQAHGAVIFAHSSDSNRRSPRNLSIARALQGIGMSTLVFDLLGPEEAGHPRMVRDIELIGTRLLAANWWIRRQADIGWSPCGLFGTGTGAAGALWAAAAGAADIGAVVSRGGHLDLIGDRLPLVPCPTLFIIGADDGDVIPAHRRAAARLRCPHRMATVPGSTPLFEEAGVLGTVARLASHWFDDFLVGRECHRPFGRTSRGPIDGPTDAGAGPTDAGAIRPTTAGAIRPTMAGATRPTMADWAALGLRPWSRP